MHSNGQNPLSTSRFNWLHDWQYGAAIVAALMLWSLLFLFDSPPAAPGWVLIAPWLFVSLVLVQPVLEEIVFRGALQGWLIKKNWGHRHIIGITSANVVTSIVFVAMHFLYHAPLMALLVLIPSLLFGYFRDRYKGQLIPCIILHCFYNMGYFLLYTPALPSP